MNIKNLILALAFGLIVFSCSSPLDKTYNEVSEKEDLFAIKDIMESSDYNMFTSYLFKHKSEGESFTGKSYSSILLEAQNEKEQEFLKLKNERENAKEEEEEEEEKLALEKANQLAEQEKAKKTEKTINLICSGKWGVHYEKLEFLDINPELPEKTKELAKNAFNVDPKENWIIFNKDGTSEILDEENNSSFRRLSANKTMKRSWTLEGNNIIFNQGILNDSKHTTLEIIQLSPEVFEVTKIDEYINITFRSLMKMKKIND